MTGLWMASRDALARLRGLGRRGEMERRLDDEMAFHVDQLTERYARDGLPPDEARRRALAAFGGRERFKDDARDEYRSRVAEEVGRDVRYAARTLRRAPVFAAAAILTLALGIGATTVIYSVVDHVVLRPLAFHEPDRLVVARVVVDELRDTYPSVPANAMHVDLWRRECTVCSGVAALTSGDVTLTDRDGPERLAGVRASASLFSVLGARAQRGRLFAPGDDQPGNANVVVLSDAFWRRQYGADPDIVGETITLNDQPHVVIGILPAGFRLPKGQELGELTSLPPAVDVYTPLVFTPARIQQGGSFDYAAILRLRPGVSLAQAQTQLDALEAGLIDRWVARMGGERRMRAILVPLREQVVGDASRALLLLLAAVGAVLLIVCVNLAMLLLARNAARLRESAVRVALGAGRGRLVRQAFVESLLLALVGGGLGIVLAYWGLAALLAAAPVDLPRLGEIRLDGRVLGVALLLSVGVGLVFGVVPALRFGRVDPGDVLKAGGRTLTAGRRGARVRAALVAAQVGLSAVLLVAAGLFLASFVRVLGVDRGFDAQRVLALDIFLPRVGYDSAARRVQFYEQAVARLSALPGVTTAAVTNRLPLEGETWVDALMLPGREAQAGEELSANFRFVSPDYFSALGIPIRQGRTFTASDDERPVIVLSEQAARALWPGEDPIGKQVTNGNFGTREVVGVAADVPTTSLEDPRSVIAYLPQVVEPMWAIGWSATLLVRADGEPTALAPGARQVLRELDPGVAIAKVRTMEQVLSSTLAQRRFHLLLLALFAVAALVTASVGIYGVIAHSLAQRTGEIGVRMALGARPRDIRRHVLREGLTPALLGLAGGLAVALLLGRAFQALLFEVRPSDPRTLGAVSLILLTVAAAACYIPARRATAGDVSTALRLE
ncbi:MAG TPA: ABC transporter permease [Gemmatimonadaceae bacterium]|nr:ABC transporter permease [Gemmatimonadaceae bacterium]